MHSVAVEPGALIDVGCGVGETLVEHPDDIAFGQGSFASQLPSRRRRQDWGGKRKADLREGNHPVCTSFSLARKSAQQGRLGIPANHSSRPCGR